MKKNEAYLISEQPKIVGIVKRVKSSRDNRWVVSATNGQEYVYNANSGRWCVEGGTYAEFDALSDSKLLVTKAK